MECSEPARFDKIWPKHIPWGGRIALLWEDYLSQLHVIIIEDMPLGHVFRPSAVNRVLCQMWHDTALLCCFVHFASYCLLVAFKGYSIYCSSWNIIVTKWRKTFCRKSSLTKVILTPLKYILDQRLLWYDWEIILIYTIQCGIVAAVPGCAAAMQEDLYTSGTFLNVTD